MSNGNTSVEVEQPLPIKEATPSELLEIIALRIQKLGPAIAQIRLAERDLRLIAARDPQLIHALDRADQLSGAREAIEQLLDSMIEQLPVLPVTQPLGELALNQTAAEK